MATFRYKALDAAGKARSGFLESDSQGKAFQQLRSQGLTPTKLESAHGPSRTLLRSLWDRVSAPGLRLSESLYYIATMLETGSALTEALEIVGRMAGKRASAVWMAVRDAVATGVSFSKALQTHAPQFPQEYIRMIRVSEGTGSLASVLGRIATFESRRAAMGNKLLTALIYPSVILLVGLAAVYFLLVYVMPDLTRVFAASGQDLPLKTEVLLAAGTFLQGLGPLAFVPPLLLVLLGVSLYSRHQTVKLGVDKALWRIGLVRKDALARFAHMLGFQLEAGIALVQAMDGAASTVRSAYLQALIREAQQDVMAGQPLDRVLTKQGAYPDMFLLSITAGQKSGKLGAFTLRLAGLMEQEVDNALKRALALVEPAMILLTGIMVGFIVLAIMEPIFDLSSQVR